MTDSDEHLQPEIDVQARRVKGLQIAVFSQTDPAANETLLGQLAQALSKLTELQQELNDSREEQGKQSKAAGAEQANGEAKTASDSGTRGPCDGRSHDRACTG